MSHVKNNSKAISDVSSFLQRFRYQPGTREIESSAKNPPLPTLVFNYITQFLDLNSKLKLRLTCKDLYQRTVVSPFYLLISSDDDLETYKKAVQKVDAMTACRPAFENANSLHQKYHLRGEKAFTENWPKIIKSVHKKNSVIVRLELNLQGIENLFKKINNTIENNQFFDVQISENLRMPCVEEIIINLGYDYSALRRTEFTPKTLTSQEVLTLFQQLLSTHLSHFTNLRSLIFKEKEKSNLLEYHPKSNHLLTPHLDMNSLKNIKMLPFENIKSLHVYPKEGITVESTCVVEMVKQFFPSLKTLVLECCTILMDLEMIIEADKEDSEELYFTGPVQTVGDYYKKLNGCPDIQSVETLVLMFPEIIDFDYSSNDNSTSQFKKLCLFIDKFPSLTNIIVQFDPYYKTEDSLKEYKEAFALYIQDCKKVGRLNNLSSFKLERTNELNNAIAIELAL